MGPGVRFQGSGGRRKKELRKIKNLKNEIFIIPLPLPLPPPTRGGGIYLRSFLDKGKLRIALNRASFRISGKIDF
jgi:hypothetical protein